VTPVIIGVDPHKRSATIEIIDEREHVLHTGRFGTDQDGYRRMLVAGIRSGCGRSKAVRVSAATSRSAGRRGFAERRGVG
jgi:hypothetical protein